MIKQDIRNIFRLIKELNYTATKNKTLSIEEYLNKTIPNLKDIINNLKKLTHGKVNQQ